MRIYILVLLVPGGIAAAALPPTAQTALVKKYCAVCHTDAASNGGLSLEHYDAARPDPGLATMLLSKLRNGAMGAAGLGIPDQETQDAWVSATVAQAAGAAHWTVIRDQAGVSAGIVREVAPRKVGADAPVYRLMLSCNPTTRQSEMQLAWSPEPQTGRTLNASFDGQPSLAYPIEGREKMGNGTTAQTGHAAVSLSEGHPRLALPRKSLTIRDLFDNESVDFPFTDLPANARRQLSACF